MQLNGKAAIVTGGASGIGRATALALAREGVRVIVADIDRLGAEETARRVQQASGNALALGCDVTDVEQFQRAIDTCERAYGGLDILFNNAGVATGLPGFPDGAISQWERTLEINLFAVILGTQLAIPALRRRGGGAIVNTASTAALGGLGIDPVYAASKGGVLLFTRSLAGLRGSDGIRVNCICPGVVETPLVLAAENPELRALAERLPTLQPEDIAEAVLDLLGDDDAAGRALVVSASRARGYLPE
jgi:NAD(P)-dependent dehydrogenase (short-subunit alcohol dehydrogenase family)